MTTYVVYSPTNGEILYTVERSDTSAGGIVFPEPSGSYITTDMLFDADVQYRVNLTTLAIEEKPYIDVLTAITSVTDSPATISNLPDCTAEYREASPNIGQIPRFFSTDPIATDDITDGVLNLTVDLAGEYYVILTSTIYLTTTIVLTVEDA